ncbi:hypothetical protein RKE29_12870 [Streptomyces sp. B1866]|uniref:hypothetical protein n=1 Tax=Streptomyces sp. B1866 TaxID=3075431 RepID=UPI00288C8159|nr:hypothetical protein [Streptomyces sp. B1866]MDT3397533.1 hypothetical protein [Streptomyces sp. B1866]
MRTYKPLAVIGSAIVVGGAALAASPAQAAFAGEAPRAVVAQSAASPAGHVSAQARRDVCFTGACGSATVKFTGRTSANVSMSVKDTRCDATGPKMRIQAQQWSYANQRTYVWNGPWRKNTKGCHGGYQQWNSAFRGEEPLFGMRVQICNGSRCKTSSWMPNDY